MDENPYRSPVSAGAVQPSKLGLVISRIVWVGLGLLGTGTALLGLSIFWSAFAYGRISGRLALGVGSAMLWMGAFLVVRAIKRFRRPVLPVDSPNG